MPDARLQRTRDAYPAGPLGISIRFVQQFDADAERVDSVERAVAEIRRWWGDPVVVGPGSPWNTIEPESH